MKKDAYYFPHFSNARNDSKLIKLRRILGLEGYAIYFMLLEILREQKEFKYPIDGIEDLAYEWHTSKEKISAVINNFGLFVITDDLFFSIRLIEYMQPYLEKKERARNAAKIRWDNANAYANALPEHSESNAHAIQVKKSKVNKSKVNESKGKERTIPTEFEFLEYAKVIAHDLGKRYDKGKALNKYKACIENDWRDGNDNLIKNWKGKFRNLLKYEFTDSIDSEKNVEYQYKINGNMHTHNDREKWQRHKSMYEGSGGYEEIKILA